MYSIEPDAIAVTPSPVNFTPALFSSRRIASLLRQRQIDRERRSLTDSAALRGDRSAVQLNQVPRHRKAQPESALLSRDRSFRLSKTIEDVGQKLR